MLLSRIYLKGFVHNDVMQQAYDFFLRGQDAVLIGWVKKQATILLAAEISCNLNFIANQTLSFDFAHLNLLSAAAAVAATTA